MALTAGRVEQRLRELGYQLPAPPPPVANYVGAVVVGRLVFVSGHGPFRDGEMIYRGKVGKDMDIATAKKAAELVILNALASLKAEIADLDRVKRIVKLLGMVNSALDFTEQPKVIDAASDLLTAAFGDRGRHARSAVGMASLPFGISVEIEMVVELQD
ncbi:MAG: RidA family protein [Actinomycetota bacterium]